MTSRHGWAAPRALGPRSSPALAMPAIALATIAALALAGCTSNSTDGTARIADAVTDDACTMIAAEAPAGHTVFTVKDSGSKVAEFYVYASDGTKIVAEVENVGPGISRESRAAESRAAESCAAESRAAESYAARSNRARPPMRGVRAGSTERGGTKLTT